MNKFLFVVLILFVNESIADQWVPIFEGEAGDLFHISPSTLRKNKDISKIWLLVDIKKGLVGFPNIKSMKQQVEYDCKKETNRTLYIIFYAGDHGSGEIINSQAEPEKGKVPNPIIPDTIDEEIFRYVCGLK